MVAGIDWKNNSKFIMFSLVHFLFTFIGDWNIFSFDTGFEIYIIVKCLVFIFLILFWNKIGCYWSFYRQNSRLELSLKFFMGYFSFLMALLFCIWPGNWFYDDIEILNYAYSFTVLFWQHKLTGIFYIFSLSILPLAAGVVIMQSFFCACIFSALMVNFQKMFRSGRWIYLCYVPFLSAPVLLQVMFPLRMTLFSFLLLYVLFEIAYWMKQQTKIPGTVLLKIFLFTAVFSAWRTEAVIYLFFIPFMLIYCFYRKMRIRIWGIGTVLLFISYLGLSYFQNFEVPEDARDKYFYTGLINPLAALVKSDLDEDAIRRDLPRINRIINTDLLKKYETGEQAFFSEPDMIHPDPTPTERMEFKKAYISLVLHHLDRFIAERWTSFKNSNVHFMVEDLSKSELKRHQELDRAFMNQPLSYSLRSQVLSWLANVRVLYEPVCYWWILWGTLIFSIWRKEKFLLLFSGILLIHMGIVICTAPQYFHMYYFTFQLCSYVGILYVLFSCCFNGFKKT